MNPRPSINQSFSVTYRYSLHSTRDAFAPKNPLLDSLFGEFGRGHRIKALFVIDQGVARCFPDLQEQIGTYCDQSKHIEFRGALVLPGGEAAKNDPVHVEKVLRAIESEHICRHSFVVAIGGGALIDMVGYASALAHRGVRHIRIPTTVLAQNDAAVGVKNGVNYFGKKNFLGTFSIPFAVINDDTFLRTLDDRDWISGMAEAMKVALLKDPVFFDFLDRQAERLRQRDPESMNRLIHRCAEIHMQHIAQGGDPFERGSSRPLDFGHWSAHRLEYLTGYALRHGEAVAMGIALDLRYSCLKGWLNTDLLERIYAVFERLGFDLGIPLEEKRIAELLQGLEEFQEHLGGNLTLAMIREVGDPFDIHEVDLTLMRKAIDAQLRIPGSKISRNAAT